MTPLDGARLYIARGWRVIPILAGQKGPRARGWQNLVIGLADLDQHFSGGAEGNIGVLLGPASGELVDIDLDCAEALDLADKILLLTQAEFGRASKPRSHRIYVAPGAVYETFADPLDGSTLLELRAQGRDGGGHQTMFPPSTHPSGEGVEWHGAVIAPAVVSSAELRLRAAWLAVGALVRRHISIYASEHPGPDLPDLLQEADPRLGEAARRWLKVSDEHTARTARLRPRHELPADEIDMAEMVAAIPNNEDWDGWNALGLALYAATGGGEHGAVLFDDWSAKSGKYNPYVTADRWSHYHRSPPSRTGVGKLIALALASGWRPDRKASAG